MKETEIEIKSEKYLKCNICLFDSTTENYNKYYYYCNLYKKDFEFSKKDNSYSIPIKMLHRHRLKK